MKGVGAVYRIRKASEELRRDLRGGGEQKQKKRLCYRVKRTPVTLGVSHILGIACRKA